MSKILNNLNISGQTILESSVGDALSISGSVTQNNGTFSINGSICYKNGSQSDGYVLTYNDSNGLANSMPPNQIIQISGDVSGIGSTSISTQVNWNNGDKTFLKLDGGQTMSGYFNLAGDATESLQPVTLQQAKSLSTNIWNDRGSYDASSNIYPSSGGSGNLGMISKGDMWTISTNGNLYGDVVNIGDTIRALSNLPAQLKSNWAISKNALSVSDMEIINSTLIGFNTITGTITQDDTILSAIEKLNGNLINVSNLLNQLIQKS